MLETERLRLRKLTADDAGFILRLLNDPSYIRHIGDRGVRDLEGARAYIANGPVASYERHGFGLWLAELKGSDEPVGVCGVLRREGLDAPDIGYALLPEYRSRGLAFEAASAVAAYAFEALGLTRLLAITDPANESSMRLLARAGFRREGTVKLPGDEAELSLFAKTAG